MKHREEPKTPEESKNPEDRPKPKTPAPIWEQEKQPASEAASDDPAAGR